MKNQFLTSFEIVVRFKQNRSWLSSQIVEIWYKKAKAKRIIRKFRKLKQVQLQFRFEKGKSLMQQH